MHFRTQVKKTHRHAGNDEYTDGMIEHDGQIGELPQFLDQLGIANDSIVQCSTDNGPHYNTWPNAGPMQTVASRFLVTLKDYPPSQPPGDWSLSSLEKQIRSMTGSGK